MNEVSYTHQHMMIKTDQLKQTQKELQKILKNDIDELGG